MRNDHTDEIEPRERELDPQRQKRGSLPPLLPKNVRIDDTGNGVRVTVISRGRNTVPLSGSIRYDIHWVAQCDPSTDVGVASALGRSIIIDNVIEPAGEEDAAAAKFITDHKYQVGWFFVTGINTDNERSAPSPPRQIGGGMLDTSVPPNVQHSHVSESGEVHNGTTYSAVAVSYQAPAPLAGFHSVQPVLKDYPNRGDVTSLTERVYQGLGGGSASFKLILQAARRPGLGTVTTIAGNSIVTFGVPENALVQAAPGDLLEVLGVRGTILTVDTVGQVTLDAPWAGESVVALTSYLFLGKVGMYLRSVSAGGGYDPSLANLPFHEVVLDAELSQPNPPTLAAETAGNVVRLRATLPEGTQIAHAVLYRGTGSAVAFSACEPILTWPADQVRQTATLQHEDSKFTVYEKEHGQFFTYYAVTVNVRGQHSPPSVGVSASCRLDSGDDSTIGRRTERNLLWNSHIMGTNAAQVLAGDTAQDVGMGGMVPTPGHYRWIGGNSGGVSLPGHQNATEIILPFQGVGDHCFVTQRIDAWDSPLTATTQPRIDKNSYYVLSVYGYSSGGTPNGQIKLHVDQYTVAGVFTAKMLLRERLSDDTFAEVNDEMVVDASELVDDDVVRIYGVFKSNPASIASGTGYIVPTITYANGVGPANVLVLRAMFSVGTDLSVWTPEMVASGIMYPPPTGGPPFRDTNDDGGRRGQFYDVP